MKSIKTYFKSFILGVLVHIDKGAYYRPRKSVLGLGELFVCQDEQFCHLTEKPTTRFNVLYKIKQTLCDDDKTFQTQQSLSFFLHNSSFYQTKALN